MTSIKEQVILRRVLARGGLFAAAITSLILLLPLSASALTFHWIGGATGNWNNGAEWDTIDAGGSEASWPSTTGDIAIFPATLSGTTTVIIPDGVNAVFGELRILTNSTVTIEHGGTGRIVVSTPSESDNGDITIQGNGGHVISAPIRMDRHVTVHVSDSVASMVFSGGIGQTGVRNFHKTGPGRVRFNGSVNNTYTGTTTVASGLLELQHSFFTTPIVGLLVIGQGVPAPNTARVSLLAHHQIANASNVTVKRDGTFLLNSFSETVGDLTVDDGTVTLGATGDLFVSGLSISGGTINLGNGVDSTFVLHGNVTATSSTLSQSAIVSTGGTFSLSGADRTFTVTDGPASNDLVINAPIIGTGGERLFKDGGGVMVMGGAFANSYLGFTVVRDGRLNLSKTVSPAIAGPLAIGDGVGAANSAEVRLTVANQIENVMPVEIASDGLLEMNSFGDTFETLQINGGNLNVGPVSDLTTSTITLSGGIITIGTTAALRLTGGVTFATSTAARTAVIGGSGTLHLNGATRSLNVDDGPQAIDLRIDANIAGIADEILGKTGPGVALFTGTGSYSGQTVIGEGTLLVNGTLNPAGFVLPSASSATLGGTGNVGPDRRRRRTPRSRTQPRTPYVARDGSWRRLSAGDRVERNDARHAATIRCA